MVMIIGIHSDGFWAYIQSLVSFFFSIINGGICAMHEGPICTCSLAYYECYHYGSTVKLAKPIYMYAPL